MSLLWRWARALRRRRGGDEGSAVVEFVFLGVLVTLPVFYLVLTLARVQAGVYAASSASREAGRTFVTAPNSAAAAGRAQAAGRISFADQGFGSEGTVRISCSGQPCLTPGASVRARADVSVRLPFIPDFVADAVPSSIPISAQHVETVDRFGAPR